MKWNGRSYRPINSQVIRKKPFNFEEAIKPYGEKEIPVWNSIVAVNVSEQVNPPVSPTPSITPSITPTHTVTPSITPSITVSVTPSITPSITASVTPSITPTLTPSSTPPALTGQTEANAYLSAVIAGGGTLDATMSGATQQLFNSLFVNNLYTKLFAFYPLLGGNSSGGQAVNAKTPGTRNMIFNGGLTFSNDGFVSNGTNGFANTQCNNSAVGTLNNFHMSFYSRTNQQVGLADFDMGITDNINRTQLNSRSISDDIRGVVNSSGAQAIFANADSTGLFTITRRGATDTEVYRNSTSLGNSATASVGIPVGSIFLARRNNTNSEIPTTRQYAFATLGTALSDTDVTNLYNAIQTFQTTLGRQV